MEEWSEKGYLTTFSISAGFQMVGNALFFPPAHLLFFSITDISTTTATIKCHPIKMAKFRTYYTVLWKEDYKNQSYSLLKDSLFYFLLFSVCGIMV